MSTRKQRARETEALVAAWFREHGWPYAEPVGAGRPGADVTGVPGLAPEVKARTNLDIGAALRQADNHLGAVPFVVTRLNGQGPATVGDWPVIVRLRIFTALLRAAGYGDPKEVA